MATDVVPDVKSPVRAESAAARQVRRTPLYLESQGQSLFAWLHIGSPTPARAQGVVICPPLGYEQVHSHRSLRCLADAMALAGMTVLRFDYQGTGDSAGVDEEAGRLAVWLANIRDALAWLRQHLGGAPVSLFGLRLGAALALRAACDHPVDRLVLWAPAAGRAWMREMKALSLTAAAGRPQSSRTGAVEAAGFAFTRQTTEDVSELDPLQCFPRCRRILLATREDGPPDIRLASHLAALGCRPDLIRMAGFAEMLAEPHYTRVPRKAINQTVGWLLPDDAADKIKADSAATEVHLVGEAVIALESRPPVRERPVSISRLPDLFGIISEPAAGAPSDLPTVVLLNAGSVYRVGPGRLYVLLARRLASLGFRCLRLDLCGLGDSVTVDANRENDPYPGTAFRDVDLTLEYLQSECGVNRVVLMGLCAGAYNAFQSAVHLKSPLLVQSVLINPLTFYWQEGMTLESAPAARHMEHHYYLTAALQPDKWLRMFSGRTRIGLSGVIKLFLERWRMKREVRNAAGPSESENRLLTHPSPGNLGSDLDQVVRAGRPLTFVFSRSDPGFRLLTFHAGRKASKLRRAGKIDVSFIDEADHTFSTRASRENLIETIAGDLCRRYNG